MSKLLHGPSDEALDQVGEALDALEQSPSFKAAETRADYYRRNDVSIRVRIISKAFSCLDRTDRHIIVEKFLSENLAEEILEDITLLILLSPAETNSLVNQEYENPIPSLL